MTRRLALPLLLATLTLGTALAGSGSTVTYYAGFCPEEGNLNCDFAVPPGATTLFVRATDSIRGSVCYEVQWVIGSEYAYDTGYGSGYHAVRTGATRINVYVGNLEPAWCILERGRIAPPVTGSVTVEWT